MSSSELPKAFVWTKIQTDAGQTIHRILNRKELERQSGGTFWWGIGESKAEKVELLTRSNTASAVIFSKMLSRPHRRDSHPDGVVGWETYDSADGKIPVPPHVIVTSRAHDSRGRPKQRHYALVCQSPIDIHLTEGGSVDARTLRNFGNSGRLVGSSQITAVVERMPPTGHGLSYPITARATLIAPHAVQLSSPRELSQRDLQLLEEVSVDGKTADDWLAVATRLRRNGSG